MELDAKSAVLLDANTGALLYAFNKDEALPPASVTKIMTLLLVMEAVDSGVISLDDPVTVSDYAASMGGSQIYLEPGETMSVRDMIKSVVIASANDAAVALAELVAGSEESFVNKMNERAKALGMENTYFENVTGLDDDAVEHLISAYDIALMSRELIRHEAILEYTSIWMDTVRDGAFGLTNTNRLIRFYKGATGLKTGSTSKAKFCISATAKRDNLHLIAVIMGASSRDARNIAAQKLLDFGFANYAIYRDISEEKQPVSVLGGKKPFCLAEYATFELLVNKGDENKIQRTIQLKEDLAAPVSVGDVVGSIIYTCEGKEVGRCDILASDTVEKIDFWGLYQKILQRTLLH
ncbi:MAG: D-alanyl-D-alanine carboxypeptidase [Clostridia bacterium]|nr:D-alanyl-D-alanine carboxypeptidase [Clostridia bacterium]